MLSILIVSALPSRHRRAWGTNVLCVLAGLWSAACVVPQARYDAALAKIRKEKMEHDADRAALYQKEQALERARADIAYRDDIIAANDAEAERLERAAADSEFAHEVVDVERREQQQLVEQLRGELAQVGRHLEGYSAKSTDLASRLQIAEARVAELEERQQQERLRGELVRDLALSLGGPIANELVVLEVAEAGPVIRIRENEPFRKGSRALTPAVNDVVVRVANAVRPVASAVVLVCDSQHDADAQGDEARAATPDLAETLKNQGLAGERVVELQGCAAVHDEGRVAVRLEVGAGP